MKIAGPYAGWLTMTVWRKKSTLLILTLTTILMILTLQYYSRKEIGEGQSEDLDQGKVESVQEKRSLLGGSSVQFVMNIPPVTGPVAQDIRLDESPSREMIIKSVRDNNIGEIPSYNNLPYIPKQRLLHLDLKGAPPKVFFLKKVLQLSKELGATGVLMEWEDMFPWSGPLATLAATNAYTRADVKEILQAAKANQLLVIPLIQTFGHVEFALKQQEFSHLREVPESAQALCPSLNASLDFVQLMIDQVINSLLTFYNYVFLRSQKLSNLFQVMELHADAKYLHVGCDEVFQIGECMRCRMQSHENLFLNHVVKVATMVRMKYPNTTPIIWDDMLRHLAPNSLDQYHIGQLVEPMVIISSLAYFFFSTELIKVCRTLLIFFDK
jgi:hexosaminidase